MKEKRLADNLVRAAALDKHHPAARAVINFRTPGAGPGGGGRRGVGSGAGRLAAVARDHLFPLVCGCTEMTTEARTAWLSARRAGRENKSEMSLTVGQLNAMLDNVSKAMMVGSLGGWRSGVEPGWRAGRTKGRPPPGGWGGRRVACPAANAPFPATTSFTAPSGQGTRRHARPGQI